LQPASGDGSENPENLPGRNRLLTLFMRKEIVIGGKRVFYRVYGEGRPVLLVHGFGETGDVWKNQVEFFKDKVWLIVPDLPGSGQSETIADMSMEGLAEVLKAIVDTELSAAGMEPEDGSLILIGHSMGGYSSLAFAAKHPSYLKGLGLFHSTAYADSEEKKATRRKGIAFIREHGGFEFLKTSTPNLFSSATKAENQPLIDSFIQSLNNFSGESLVSYYEAMMNRQDRTAVLKSASFPVLFVMGEHDTAIPLEDGLKLCSLPEKSYIHILTKSGHMGMMEEVGNSNEILDKFFEDAGF
jgi:pimeloyl-ACP methyl ester carboxylesterase